MSAKLIGLHLHAYCFDDRYSLHIIYTYNLVNKVNLVHNFSQQVYLFSVHVSGDYVPNIRRNNCIYATLGTCYSEWMSVWYAGYIPDSRPYRITNTKCRINTVISPDDGHMFDRDVQRKEINIPRKTVIVHQVGFMYKIIEGCTEDKT